MKSLGKARPVLFLAIMLIVSISLTGCSEVIEGIMKIFEGVKQIGTAIFGGGSKDKATTDKATTDKATTDTKKTDDAKAEADAKKVKEDAAAKKAKEDAAAKKAEEDAAAKKAEEDNNRDLKVPQNPDGSYDI